MNDLIERLRSEAEMTKQDFAELLAYLRAESSQYPKNILRIKGSEAATLVDEIERLRAENEWLHEQLRLATVDQATAEAEASDAHAENKRLREEVDALAKDAAKYRWGINNARWIRSEQEAYVAIPVAPDADLSCVAMRDAAIDAALSKENSDARAALAKAEGR